MEFVVIKTGGKQYKAVAGDTLRIEKLTGEHKVGDTVVFDKVLLRDNGSETTIGTPFIAGAKATGTIESIGRAAKIDVIHYKQKSRYYKKAGHRQPYFEVKINSIK